MKKIVSKFLGFMFALVLVFGLASCDKSGSVKKAFEKEGYTVESVKSTDEEAQSALKLVYTEDELKKMGDYELIFVSKKGSGLADVLGYSALIIKFDSAKELKNGLTTEDKDGKKDTSAYDEAEKNGYINGNCVIIPITGKDDVVKIFKKA